MFQYTFFVIFYTIFIFPIQPRSRKGKNFKSKAEVDDEIDDSDTSIKSVNDTNLSVSESGGKKTSKKQKDKSDRDTVKKMDEDSQQHHHHKGDKKKKKKDKEEKKKKKDKDGPMHFTARAEPVAISQEGVFEEDLPKDVFLEVIFILTP